MEENVSKAVEYFKESEEYFEIMENFYYDGRTEVVDLLRPKNPTLDTSDLDEVEVSQETSRDNSESRLFDPVPLNVQLPEASLDQPKDD